MAVEPDGTQVEICEFCATPGCASGSWVSFRRCGEHVLWIPAFELVEEGPYEAFEYPPPDYHVLYGVPMSPRSPGNSDVSLDRTFHDGPRYRG